MWSYPAKAQVPVYGVFQPSSPLIMRSCSSTPDGARSGIMIANDDID